MGVQSTLHSNSRQPADMKFAFLLVIMAGFAATMAQPTDEARGAVQEVLQKWVGSGQNCNDYGCCSCSRQDKYGNRKWVGGKCRIERPIEKHDKCKDDAYCTCE